MRQRVVRWRGRARASAVSCAALLVLVVTSSCGVGAADPSRTPVPTPTSTIDALCAQSIVEECTVDPESIVVTIGADASDDETLQLARDLHAAAAYEAPEFGAQLRRAPVDIPPIDAEYATPAPWEIGVFPAELDDVERLLTDILTVEDITGALGIARASGWPSVTFASLDEFDAGFDAVAGTPMFADGGTYTLLSLDERLRIVHTPQWVTDAGVHEVVAIARAYPQAEVLLEAAEGGAQPPTLYVSRLSAEEIVALDARLSDAEFAGFSVTGDPIEYVLGSLSEGGTQYVGGLIGRATP